MVSTTDRSALGALGRRVASGLVTAWAAVSLTFFGLRLGAGDPVAALLAQGLATPAQAEAYRHDHDLDRPLLVQYLGFLSALSRGDLGDSFYTDRPVTTIIAEQFPATAELATAGFAMAIVLGLLLGVAAAWYGRSAAGRLSGGLANLATSLPVAFTGILALLVFGILRRPSPNAGLPGLRHLLLPAAVLGFSSAGAIARVVEAGLRESLRAPYILAARARGLPAGPRLLWHALRPSLPPAVSLTALEAAYLFTGTVVTETVFSRPGLGRLLVAAILQGDFPVAQGVVALAALVYTASHVLADASALALDPRLRGQA
jgi:peptide/nickel transport system permease protein